ncbi:hypothetical protein TSAR_005926 [Trichomalopsis sarcophagae]|uniref:Uncharacterized protein n=1 Tax=Trichomalopsis sarcophagae TaxID=543379 RepID=A0A232FE54_9HYME|nr:hypothetical protein TSAR_005926 [Trichomalopsis sarcophagae]
MTLNLIFKVIGKTLKKQVETLKTYLAKPDADPINANLRLTNITALYKDCIRYNEELESIESDNPHINAFSEIESKYYDLSTTVTTLQNVEPIANSTLNNSTFTITERQDVPKLSDVQITPFTVNVMNGLLLKTGISLLYILVLISVITLASAYLPVVPSTTSANLSMLLDKARTHLNMLERLKAKPSSEINWMIYSNLFSLIFINYKLSNPCLQIIVTTIIENEPVKKAINRKSHVTNTFESSKASCPKCNECHRLFKCPDFNKLKFKSVGTSLNQIKFVATVYSFILLNVTMRRVTKNVKEITTLCFINLLQRRKNRQRLNLRMLKIPHKDYSWSIPMLLLLLFLTLNL